MADESGSKDALLVAGGSPTYSSSDKASKDELAEERDEGWMDVLGDGRVMSVCVATGILLVGLGMTNPIVPSFGKELDGAAWSVGMSFSVFGLARLVLNVPIGWAADLIGRKPLLVLGCVCCAVGTALSSVSPTMGFFIMTRGIAGAGNSCYLGTAMAYLADHATPRTRARVLGANQFALLVGVTVGPAFGGLAARCLGNRAPFLIIASLSSCAALWTQIVVPSDEPQCSVTTTTSTPERTRIMRSLLADPRFLSVGACQFAIFALRQGGRNLILAYIATTTFQYQPPDLGDLYAAMSFADLLFLAPAATAADIAPDRRFVAVPSLSLTALAVACLALVPRTQSHPILLAAASLWALSHAFLGPTLPAYAADIAPSGHRALALALFRSCGDLGTLLAPAILGLVIDLAGPSSAALALASYVLLAALSFAVVGRGPRVIAVSNRRSPG